MERRKKYQIELILNDSIIDVKYLNKFQVHIFYLNKSFYVSVLRLEPLSYKTLLFSLLSFVMSGTFQFEQLVNEQ